MGIIELDRVSKRFTVYRSTGRFRRERSTVRAVEEWPNSEIDCHAMAAILNCLRWER